MKLDLSSAMPKGIRRGVNYIKNRGLDGIMSDVRYMLKGPGPGYDGWYKKKHAADKEELERQRNNKPVYAPLVSIIVSVYRTPAVFLSAMMESVIGQTYQSWELIIVDGSRGTGGEGIPETGDTVRKYESEDSRIRYILLDEDLGISGCLNLGVEAAKGEYIAALSHDDVIAPEALYTIVSAIQDDRADIVYSDEDKMNEEGTRYSEPSFKPDFDIDLLRAYNYIGYFTLIKKSLLRSVGGFRKEFEGVQDYDLILRCCEAVWSDRGEKIHHVPYVLYHVRKHGESAAREKKRKNRCETGRKAVEAHLGRMGVLAVASHIGNSGMYRITYDTPANPMLSVVIVGSDSIEGMKRCILPLYERARYSNFELIIVDGYAEDVRLGEFYRKLQGIRRNINIIPAEREDNALRLMGKGASFANGDYVLFLDADSEVMEPASMGIMLGICMREDVGAVGGVMYNEGKTAYHSCLSVDSEGTVRDVYRGIRYGDKSYHMRNCVSCGCSAVSSSCMLVKKEIFKRTGGFSDKFTGTLADTDLCLRIIQHGLSVVTAAEAAWQIHNVKSVGADAPSAEETDLFGILWGRYFAKGDRYLSNPLL